ncbi:MAG: diguanylate cyclase [Deltaproteobacteria bacterium]|jgi:GGDEF domain-containing protein|nr:diguanylate cyclase [Deltaproteobacteria bacterium]
MHKLSEIAGHALHIFLLAQDEELIASLQSLWPADQIAWTVFADGQSALEQVFSEPPDIVIAEQFLPGLNGIDVLRMMKEENVYRQVCAILVVRHADLHVLPSAAGLDVDELVILPASDDKLRMRVELALHRSSVTMDANPLTRLPGNTSIIHTIQRLIANGADFALAYTDMDNFKPYNDKYGFSRGDEMLLMTARLIVNTVSASQGEPSFVGHIGGDDFVFILPPDVMEDACKRLVGDFDAIVPSFYDPGERAQGYILSHDRQGHELRFPILSISIAVARNVNARYTHYAQLSHVAGQLKKAAKAIAGSSYVIDRRL